MKSIRQVCYGHYGQVDGIARHIRILIRQGAKPRSLQLPKIAKRFKVDEEILRTVFQQRHGISVQKYVTKERLTYLQDLLVSPKPVKVIALELGFKKSCMFSTEFIRLAGMGPREWRKQAERGDFKQNM